MAAAVLLVLSGHSSSGKGRFRWFFPACSLTTLSMPSRLQTNCSFVTMLCLPHLSPSLFSSPISILHGDPFIYFLAWTKQAFVQRLHIIAFLRPGICIIVQAMDPPRHVPQFSALVQLNILISLFDAMRSKGIPTRCSRFRRLNCQEIC